MAEIPIPSLSSCPSRSYSDDTNELNGPISQPRYFGAKNTMVHALASARSCDRPSVWYGHGLNPHHAFQRWHGRRDTAVFLWLESDR